MAETDERIETYINRSGVQGDTEFMLVQLNAVSDAFARANSIKLTLGKDTSFKAATDSATQLKKATDSLTTSVNNYKAVQTEAAQVIQQTVSSYSSGGDAILKQANSLATLKLALQQNTALQKDYKKGLDDGSLSLDQYQQKTAAAILTQKEYQASISLLNKELSIGVKQSGSSGSTAFVPVTNLVAGEDESVNLKKTGDAVNSLEREEAQAVIAANEWADAQKRGAAAIEETAQAQKIALTPLEQTAARLIEQRQALGLNALAQTNLNTALSEGKISRDEWLASMAKSILVENELKASVGELNKELNLAAKADLATPGSIRDAEAQNLQLGSERSSIAAKPGIATQDDLDKIAELNVLIDKNNELIDANSDKIKKQKINIGNYPTSFTAAFGTLEQELGKVNVALQSPGLSGKQIADLTVKQNALQNATALVSKEFSTTTAQSNAYKESAKQVGQVYGTNSELFKTYATQVAAGATETAKLGEAVAAAGPKGNIFAAGFRNIYSTLRQVAYAIPGIGLAGLIGLLLEPLGALASSLFNVGNKTVDLKDKQAILQDTLKRTSEVLDSLGSEAGKGAIEVDNLKNHIQEAKQGLISSNDVVELYNSTIGKTTGAVNNLADAEDQIAKKGDAYIKYTILKAAAQLAAAKSAVALVEAEVAAEKPTQDFNTIGSRLTTFGAGQASAPGGVPGGAAQLAAGLQARNDAAKAAQDKAIAQKKNESDEFLKVEAKFVADYGKIASALGFNPDGDKIKESNEKAITSLDLQIEALTRYQNKQNEVAQTDTNTYEKRRQALVNFNAAAAKLVELNSLKSFIGVTNTNQQDQLAAKLLTDQQKTAIDGYAKLQALDESYRQRKLSAEEQIAEDSINQDIKANEAVYKNEQQALEARLEAYKDYVADQGKLADQQKNEKLASVGFSPKEIADLNNGIQVQVQGKRITNEELLALQTDYETKLANLSAGGAKEVYDITTSYAKRTQDAVRAINKANGDTSVVEEFNQDIQALNTELQLKIIGIQRYQAKRKQLEDAFAQNQLQSQIDIANRSLDAEQKHHDELNQEIINAAADLTAAENTGDRQQIDQEQARLDALLKAEKVSAAAILAVRTALNAATLAKSEDTAKKLSTQETQLNTARLEFAKTVLNGIGTIIDQRYDNEKAHIQATIDAINKKAQTDIAAENASADSAQEKQDKIEVINERAAAQTAQLAAQQKQIDIDKARFDKVKAIADIVVNTAVAISKALTTPYLIPLIAATGAVEAAIVAATPIPTYKYGAGVNGSPKHPGGDAIVGDGGRKELAVTPAGDLIVTPSIPTRMTFPRDTVVLPDANAAIDALIYSSLRGFRPAEGARQDAGLMQGMQQLIKENRQLRNVIANKQETHIHTTWSGLERSYRSGKNWLQFVDEKINWKL